MKTTLNLLAGAFIVTITSIFVFAQETEIPPKEVINKPAEGAKTYDKSKIVTFVIRRETQTKGSLYVELAPWDSTNKEFNLDPQYRERHEYDLLELFQNVPEFKTAVQSIQASIAPVRTYIAAQ